MQTLYPDLHRRRDVTPSLIEAEAREWIMAEPERWRPTWDISEPADVLAVIGVLVLTAAVRRPCGWDGAALRGPIDPVRLIASATYVERAVKGRASTEITAEGARMIFPAHETSRYWAGRVTLDRIWRSNSAALRYVLERADHAWEQDGEGSPRIAMRDAMWAAARGITLRDRLDLDRWVMIGDSLPVRGALAGKRSYLTPA